MASTPSSPDLLEPLTDLAREAGAAIREIYLESGTEVTYKADASPLTAADLASHRVLARGLGELAPDIPLLSEEGGQESPDERQRWERLWLVDPLDGTKEFIKRNGEFTVNVALIEGSEPVLGVVYAPMLDRLYFGVRGRGAWRRDGEGPPLSMSATGTASATLAVVASRSHPSPLLAAFLEQLPGHRLVSMGSSIKICLVAEGEADIYPRLGPTMEWDTAAAHAIVEAAGGTVLDFEGRALRYNKENLLNPHFIVLGGGRPVPWQEAFERASERLAAATDAIADG